MISKAGEEYVLSYKGGPSGDIKKLICHVRGTTFSFDWSNLAETFTYSDFGDFADQLKELYEKTNNKIG